MTGWPWQISARVRATLRPGKLDRDFERELESHLEMLTANHRSRGMSLDDARHASRLDLGGVAQLSGRASRRARNTVILRPLPGYSSTLFEHCVGHPVLR